MSVTLEFDFRPDGTLEDVWQLSSDLTETEAQRLGAHLTSMPAQDRNLMHQAVVSALTRRVNAGEYRSSEVDRG